MASEKLSQKEIDALLSKLKSSYKQDKGSESSDTGKTIFPFNFKSRKKINKSQFVIIESLHKRFLRNLESTFTNLLNVPVIASLAAMTELSYEEFTDSMSSPTCLYLLNITPGSGKFLMEIDSALAFYVIDKVLGGRGESTSSLNRELSLIEEKIMKRIVNMLLDDLKEAWESVEKIKFNVEGYYSQSDYIQVIGAKDKIVLISIDIRGGENVIGFINLCMPVTVIEPFLLKEKPSKVNLNLIYSGEELIRSKHLITTQLCKSIIEIKVLLGQTKISLGDLLRLEVGDVLCLDKGSKDPLDIFIENIKFFKGYPVRKDKFIAVKITSIHKRH